MPASTRVSTSVLIHRLGQARVITVGQALPIWIRTTTLVRIVVTAAWSGGKAVTSALLQNGVEVVVAPKVRQRPPTWAGKSGGGDVLAWSRRPATLRVACSSGLGPVPVPEAEACTAFVSWETAEMLGVGGAGGAEGRVWMALVRRRGRAGDADEAPTASDGGGSPPADARQQALVRLRVHDGALACASRPRRAAAGCGAANTTGQGTCTSERRVGSYLSSSYSYGAT
jgi:hypothetical protein